jgi:hypothetical protein
MEPATKLTGMGDKRIRDDTTLKKVLSLELNSISYGSLSESSAPQLLNLHSP